MSENGTRTVSVLCASRNSVYHRIPDVEVYDKTRNAFTFRGDTPIVAHPPCRAWSAFCRHQSKPEPREVELGIWCCEQLRICGGVLEQPAHSLLFDAAGLPRPTERRGHLFTEQVWQAWWGYPTKKSTWLCFSNVPDSAIQIPFQLHAAGRDRRRFQVMSKRQRSETKESFAVWLIDIARTVHA